MCVCVYIYIEREREREDVFFNVIYFSDANLNFYQLLLQFSESYDPSEIIVIC